MPHSTRTSVPESDPVAPVPESVVSRSGDDTSVDVSHLPSEHRDAVRRLLRQVETAVQTIETLRAENERLRERVAELEARPTFPEDESVFALDEEPDALKARITRFIDAIDTYLEAGEGPDPPNGDSARPSSETSSS